MGQEKTQRREGAKARAGFEQELGNERMKNRDDHDTSPNEELRIAECRLRNVDCELLAGWDMKKRKGATPHPGLEGRGR